MSRSSCILCVALAMQTVACAGGESRGIGRSDMGVTARVETRLAADPDASMMDVDVDTIDGIVTLRGEVPSEVERTSAEDVTRYTPGVRGVRNLLVVKDRTLGDATDEGFSDAWIRTRVGMRLTTDPDVRRFRIDVDVDAGVVTLSGSVANAHQRATAEATARRTEGVKRVINEITVVPKPPAPVVESSEGNTPTGPGKEPLEAPSE